MNQGDKRWNELIKEMMNIFRDIHGIDRNIIGTDLIRVFKKILRRKRYDGSYR